MDAPITESAWEVINGFRSEGDDIVRLINMGFDVVVSGNNGIMLATPLIGQAMAFCDTRKGEGLMIIWAYGDVTFLA